MFPCRRLDSQAVSGVELRVLFHEVAFQHVDIAANHLQAGVAQDAPEGEQIASGLQPAAGKGKLA